MSPFARIGFVVLALVGAAGCAPVEADVPEGADADGEEVLRRTRDTANWSYQGPMPTLDSPRVVVSLAGHTVRVTGLLPTSFTGTLPYHAITEPDPAGTGRTQVTLVYPIATGNPNAQRHIGFWRRVAEHRLVASLEVNNRSEGLRARLKGGEHTIPQELDHMAAMLVEFFCNPGGNPRHSIGCLGITQRLEDASAAKQICKNNRGLNTHSNTTL